MAEAAVKGLGQIEGLCACYTKATLNGRPYDQIYKRILAGQDYRFNEMMRRGGILCEFGHPNQYTADFERTETDPEKACALITEINEKEDGKIYAKATILDTPAGKIFKAISPMYTFGFSSRGSYEADENSTEGPDGWNQDSYIFKGFDIVALPANEGSEISATEGVGSKGKKKKIKSARESLDLQNIADAADVDPKEVDAELDKLFAEDGSLAPAELIDAHKFVDDDGTETGIKGERKGEKNSIVADLHRALADKAGLEKEIQSLLFEKSESEAAALSLQAKVKELQKMLDSTQAQVDFYEKNKEDIEALVAKLISSHDASMAESDEALAQEQAKTQSLASQVAQLKGQIADAKDEASNLFDQASREAETAEKLDEAQESIKSLRSTVESLKKKLATAEKTAKEAQEAQKRAEAAKEEATKKFNTCNKIAHSAREALLDTYSNIYSIDRNTLAKRVGNSGDAKYIKSVVESMSGDVVRLSSYSTPTGAAATKKSGQSRESFPVQDDVDKELLAGLQKEGFIK